MKKGKRLVALMIAMLITVTCCYPSISNAVGRSAELVQGDVLYEDDFTTADKYIEALGSTTWHTQRKQPTWEADADGQGGKLIRGTSADNADSKFALLNGLGAENWMNYTVEADIQTANMNSRICYVAAYGRTTGDKTYGDAYQFVYWGDESFSLKRIGTNSTGYEGGKVKVSDFFPEFNPGETIRMSITAITYENYVHLICKATYDGVTKVIISYEDGSENRYTCGLPGFGLQQQNSSLDNVKVTSVTLVQLTEGEKYICLDREKYPVSAKGIVLVNGKQQKNGSEITQAGDYTVAVTANSMEVCGMVILYYQGDATGDKKAEEQVDVKDLVRLKRGIKDDTLFTKAGKKAANMNDDTNIDEADAKLLRDMLVQ